MTTQYNHIYLAGEPEQLFKCGAHEDLELDDARLFFMGQKANAGTTSIFSGITVMKVVTSGVKLFIITSNFNQEK